MASNDRGPNTITTTTTNTTITLTRSHRSRAPASHLEPTSGLSPTTSRIYTISSNERVPSPQPSNNDHIGSEPFPGIPLEPTQNLRLSQIRTADQFPTSQPVSRVSTQQPIVSASTQIRRRPIGIKRLSSQTSTPQLPRDEQSAFATGRRRSTSAPQRPILLQNTQDAGPIQHTYTNASNLRTLVEGQESAPYSQLKGAERGGHGRDATSAGLSRSQGGSQRIRRLSDAARSVTSKLSNRSEDASRVDDEYDDKIVDILDVLDPEVSTLTTLTNVQNSLFVPDLGRWLNRRPTYELTQGPSYRSQRPALNRGLSKPLPPTPLPGPPPIKDELGVPSDIEEEPGSPSNDRRSSSDSAPSIASVLQEERYAVLPHGVSLDGWSEEEKEMLDDYVRHMLHSRREGFKRSMRAFGKYIRKPLGFLVTLYAVLITLFGLAWVLFLIGWIYVGDEQLYVINVIDNVLVALFAIVGDGMAPFRAVDTYHMIFIAHYHHLTEKIRKKRNLPKLQDDNELPEVHETEVDAEAAVRKDEAEFSVLTPEQQKKLEHHQHKFSKSHSFYKPHETTTHFAFPHRLFIAIVILLDMHSCLQITLGGVTWGIDYRVRPAALTATVLSCSITVNIMAGILIKIGDKKSRKKDVLTRMFRQELTEEAMRRVEKQKQEEKQKRPRSDDEEHLRGEKLRSEDEIREESDSDHLGSGSGTRYPAAVPVKSV